MDIHHHIFLLSGFENTFFHFICVFPLILSRQQLYDLQVTKFSSFNFQENANQENCRQYSCNIFFNWQIGTKNLTKRTFIVEPSFLTGWTMTSVNAHGRTCKKTKVYTYLYISLHENLFANGCIYISYEPEIEKFQTRKKKSWKGTGVVPVTFVSLWRMFKNTNKQTTTFSGLGVITRSGIFELTVTISREPAWKRWSDSSGSHAE